MVWDKDGGSVGFYHWDIYWNNGLTSDGFTRIMAGIDGRISNSSAPVLSLDLTSTLEVPL